MSVRAAGVADVAALMMLREQMFLDMGAARADGWQEAAAAWFRAHLDDPDVCLVVAEQDEHVVACALGLLRDLVPSPWYPSGREVTISNVCTVPASRGRGLGRAVTLAVMDMAAARGAVRAELLASPQGSGVYRALGFTDTDHPAMRATLPRPCGSAGDASCSRAWVPVAAGPSL